MKNFFIKTGLTLLCLIIGLGSAWGETYTIDFNKGTTNGTSISGTLASVGTMCSSGADNASSITGTNCYYNANGCGLRLAKSGGNGSLVVTFSSAIQSAIVQKVIVYASAVASGNTLTVTPAGTVSTPTEFSSLKTYSTSNSASTNYQLSEITINATLTCLDFYAVNAKYVMLHRIDIITGAAKTLQSITVSGTPTRTTYEVGETFDPTGLTVTGTYSEGDPEIITEGIDWTISPNNGTLSVGQTSINVVATVGNVSSDSYQVNGLTVTAPLPKITITDSNINDFTTKYKEYTWTDNNVSGKLYAYKTNGMQFNTSKDGYYVYNTDPIPGNIRSIKITTHTNGTEREWKVSVGTSQITSISGDKGTEDTKLVSKSGTLWTISGNNQYFCLVDNNGASNISEIVITYEESTTPPTPSISADNTLEIPVAETDGTFNVTWTGMEDVDVSLYNNEACTVAFNGDWFNVELDDDNNVYYLADENTSTFPRTVYMQLYGLDSEANEYTHVVTVTQAGKQGDPEIENFIKTSTLELVVGAPNYDIRNSLNIPNDYDTSTYAITTTINGLTQKDGEYACVYPYISFSKAGEYTVHVVAAAMPGKYAQTGGDITVTVTDPAPAITTIPALFTKATEVGGTDTDINLTLNNWVVSGVKDSNAYVTDGTNGFIIYQDSHGFTAGDVLNGTVACKVMLYNGSAEIVGLTSTTTGLTVSTSVEELTPTVISDLTTLSGVNTGALIKINNVQYDGTNFTDGTNSIKPYKGIMTSLPELTNGAYYNVTGVYVQYNTTKDIAPRSAEDVEEVEAEKYAINIASCENGTVTASLEEAAVGVEVTLTVTPNSGYQLSTLAVTNASTSEEITVTSNKFIMPAAAVNVAATFEEATPSDNIFYESFDDNEGKGGNDGAWSGTIASNDIKSDHEGWTFVKGNGADQCAKFGTGSAKGSATTPALDYAGDAKLTFKAGAWNSSSEKTTLNISIDGDGSTNPTSVTLTKGEWTEYTITLTGLTAGSKIKFEAANASNNRFFLDEVTVTKSSITPATEYEITIASDIENGTISASKAKAEEGDDVTITATPATGYQLATLYYTIDGDETQNTIENLTFTMPANNVTIHATFAELARYTVTFDPQAGTCEETSLEETVAGAGVTLPAAICLNKDYEFAGWATEVCEETTTMPTLYAANSTYMPTSDITLYAVYTNEGGTADNKFDKLTNLADLENGAEIVIVNNASNYVLDGNSLGGSTTQSTIADAASIYVSDASKIWTATTTGSNEWQFETTNTAKIGLQSHPGTGNRAYVQNIDSYNTWNIVEHYVDDCWTIINANGGAAIEIEYDEKYQDGNKWYAINEENPDIDEYCANRIYVKAPGAAQIYNSNPCEFLSLKAIDDDKATRWATYSNDENDVEFIEGATVYSVTAENGKITLYEESDIVPAGTGILLKFNDTSVRYVTTENAGALKNTNNMLRPSSAPMNDSGYKYYKLAYEPSGSKTGLGFYYGAEDGAPFVSAAGLAYLAIPASQEIRGFSFEEALIETAISNVTTEVMPSANTYDLQGRLTKANTRGLFIVNGKKIIK